MKIEIVQPIIDHMLTSFQRIPTEEFLALDEQLCSTKARGYLKQYLPDKPKKRGYKLFILSGMEGTRTILKCTLAQQCPF